MKTLNVNLTGTSPILLSCDRLADPLDPEAIAYKKLTDHKGKNKTIDIILAIAKKQYVNGVYYSKETGVHLPSANLKKCLEQGAKLSRNGDKIRKAVMILSPEIKLLYGAELTPNQLWDKGTKYLDKRSVIVGRARVMCYRPKFTEWSVEFEVHYDETIVEDTMILQYYEAAGKYVGLGGYRPEKNGLFGRFVV